MSWLVEVYIETHVGNVRRVNEDAATVDGSIVQARQAALVCTPSSPTVISVIDGMGGHVGGRIAAGLAARELVRPALTGWGEDVAGQATAAIHAANDALYDLSEVDPTLTGLGCVVTSLVVEDDRVILLNVGDAPAFTVEGGYLSQLHVDDARSDGALTASVGGVRDRTPVVPHRLELPLDGPQVFLLCSDGLTAAVTAEEIERGLLDQESRWERRAIEAAIAGGAPDNVTIAVVRIGAAE